MANAVILPGERLAGLSADLFHKLQAGSLTLDELALFTQRKNPFEFEVVAILGPDVFHLTVDYSQSLEQMIAAGKFDGKIDDFITKRFSIKGDGIVEYEARYFHFNRDISSGEVERLIRSEPIEPDPTTTFNFWEVAKIEHVLSYGKTFPEEPRKFPIIGLGSVVNIDGNRCVPVLYSSGSTRRLYLAWSSSNWISSSRFLAVRKVSGA